MPLPTSADLASAIPICTAGHKSGKDDSPPRLGLEQRGELGSFLYTNVEAADADLIVVVLEPR